MSNVKRSTVIFSDEGDAPFDYVLLNNQRNWAVIPAGTFQGFDEELPIRLQVGNKFFGREHIIYRHSRWLAKHQKTVEEMLHTKLNHSGTVYTTDKEAKIKINMRISPDALVVLAHIKTKHDSFFSVISLYYKNEYIDGEDIGRYLPEFAVSPYISHQP